jgi:predicted dehydrogenase
MKIGVAGLGYWGPNLVRNFLGTPGVDGVLCHDADPARQQAALRRLPAAVGVASYDELLAGCEAVALATPLSTHHALGLRALEAGRHLMVEKPLAPSVAEAAELVAAARSRGLTLLVDHTFLYTGAVRKLRELAQAGEFGDWLYFDSVRVNLGLFQHDTDVIWDLAPHDLSILDHLVGAEPVAVQAIGARHYYGHADMAYLSVFYPGELLAHVHVNWISPVKVRRILLGGTRKMAVYDDMEPSEKVKIYDTGVELRDPEQIWSTLVDYRTGDVLAPKLAGGEALAAMARDFVESVGAGRDPLCPGEAGLRVVRLLEAASRSLAAGGTRIEL